MCGVIGTNRPVAWLRDGQGEDMAASTATAAQIAGVSAWSVDVNVGCSWPRDESGRKCDLQLGTA